MRIRFPILPIRSRLALLPLVLLAMLALPAISSAAETYVVDATENVTPDVGCNGGGPGECDLGEAITLANTDGEESTIEFSVSEVKVESPLPTIEAPLTIDGTDEAGNPGVEIWKNSEGFFSGLAVSGNETTIEGIAIGGFSPGIDLIGNENRVCNSYIGTELNGVTPEANDRRCLGRRPGDRKRDRRRLCDRQRDLRQRLDRRPRRRPRNPHRRQPDRRRRGGRTAAQRRKTASRANRPAGSSPGTKAP